MSKKSEFAQTLTDEVLRLNFYLELPVLLDDVLEGDVDEAVEGGDLLRHQTVLLEVGLDDGPCIILADLLGALSRGDIRSCHLNKLLFLIRGADRRPWGVMGRSVDVLHQLVSLTSKVLTR